MSKTITLASIAAGLAAGSITNDVALELLGGDKSLMDKVLGMTAGATVGVFSASLTEDLLKSDIVQDGPLGDVIDATDDFLDEIF